MLTTHETRHRIERFCYGVLVVLCLLTLHLTRLQVLQHREVSPVLIRNQQLIPRRAGIYTRDGVAVAVSPEGQQICANPRAVANKEQAAQLLSPVLGVPIPTLIESFNKIGTDERPNYYVLLKKRVDSETAERVQVCCQQLAGPGISPSASAIYAKPVNYREYPRGDFASQLIGFVDCSGHGAEGIEYYWDKVLGGETGYVQAEVDAVGHPIPNGHKKCVPPVEGHHVILTIDDKIQFFTEQAIQKTWEKYHPNWVTALVMNPKTGEILALATKPSFNLNHIPSGLNGRDINRAVNFRYEPGSTFKIVTASAALQELPPEIVNRRFNCSGKIRVGKHTIHCWILAKEGHGHGMQSLSDGIKNSCNIAMVGFSKCLGAETLYRYAELFGVTERTGLGCPREKRGYLPRLETWDAARLANVSFGQSLMITPIELLRAVCTIANDGVMMQPYMVKEIRGAEGKLITGFHPREVRRVVSPTTAEKVRGMMERVVAEGTGKLAAVPGYRVAGKTGSAQKVVDRVFAQGKFVSSFVGFLPAEKPQLAILVVADEPKGSHWGSVVCGPAFQEIAIKSMMRLKVEPALFAERPVPTGTAVP